MAHIGEHAYGEDLTGELALANHTSMTTARYLVADMACLADHLPGCMAKVCSGEAALWQARRVAQQTDGNINRAAWTRVDQMVTPVLGTVNLARLRKTVDAAITWANPERVAARAQTSERHVYVGGDDLDPLTGWLSARLDRADAIFLDATIQLGADKLAANGDNTTLDQRRARALALLANPAAAVQLLGVPTTRGMNPVPASQADVDYFIKQTRQLAARFTPRTQIFIHMAEQGLTDTDAVVRAELIGPLLASQITQLTNNTRIKVTPVVPVTTTGHPVDNYETPAWMRNQIQLQDPWDVFPWSSTPSRHLDLDHTLAYQPGQPGQTRPDNLAPLSRHAHRLKTHCNWHLDQPQNGTYLWKTPAGQTAKVDHTGTHPTKPDP